MKSTLQFRQTRQVALTPQLQHAIRLLQLSRMELALELNHLLESNPLLDLDHDADANDPTEAAEAAGEEGFEIEEPQTPPAQTSAAEPQDAQTEDLRDHLLWQLNLTPMSPRDRAIAVVLIDAIDDDGYLLESVQTLREVLAPEVVADIEEIEAVRHRLLRFDPVGVGARSLGECLDVQLGELDAGTPGLALARLLVREQLDALARLDHARLCERLGLAAAELDVALALIRSCAPKPGLGHAAAIAEYVTPDVYARKIGGRWRVALAPGCRPRLGINAHYAGLIAKAGDDDASYLRGQLQEARWLIKSLKARADTILKVAESIVRAQQDFLESGPQAMRPLVLKDVAAAIGMHESTVSRVTTRKFLHTPRGTFELKYFFSCGLATRDGGTMSATAVQALIRRLIDEEPAGRPLSDQALARALNARGIGVARRTVSKYREAMHLAPSGERLRRI